MNKEQTFSMIKPNAVKNQYTGPIIQQIEQNGFKIIKLQRLQFTLKQAQRFYHIHKDRPFYNDLCHYMQSGPIVAMVLEKQNAIADFRQLIGPTDPLKAPHGTIRNKFGTSIDQNAIHGSDASQTAQQEINLIFPPTST